MKNGEFLFVYSEGHWTICSGIKSARQIFYNKCQRPLD